MVRNSGTFDWTLAGILAFSLVLASLAMIGLHELWHAAEAALKPLAMH